MREKNMNCDTNKIRALLRGERPDEGRSAIIYVGNGAAKSEYKSRIEQGVFEGEAYEHLGGFFDMCAIEYVTDGSHATVQNAFAHERASFAGFTVRRKREKCWEWYCADGQWRSAGETLMEKALFVQGDELTLVTPEQNETIILDARWETETGERLNCGYAMYTNALMAHAFGGMNGKTYHNTMPAFKNGIKNGYKYFEVDLSYTTDQRLVLCHGWTESNCKHTGFKYEPSFQSMTYSRLMRMKVHGNKMISARKFYKRIRRLDKYTYEIDLHNVEGEQMEKRMRALEKDFKYDQKVLDRLLIQVYSKQMYESIGDTSYFKHYQYLVGKNVHNLDDILTYALDYGICALALRFNLAKPEYIQKIKNAGLYVMCYTINKDLVVARNLLDSGVDTLCTDYITQEELKGQTTGFSDYPFRISYNGGLPEVVSHYDAALCEEEIVRVNSGTLEYKDSEIWKNDGKRRLRKCCFTVPGKRFVGWNMRVRVDGKQMWYCKDRLYHGKGDIVEGTIVEPYIFKDEEQIPVWNLEENVTFVMVAVWE